MKSDERAKQNRWAIIAPILCGIGLLCGVVIFHQLGEPPPKVDDRLCPLNSGPVGATLLFIDASDVFTPKHQATLASFFENALQEKGAMPLGPGELLVVYELTEDPGEPELLMEICRPVRDFAERTWRDDIHQGRKFAERDWQRFEEQITDVPADEKTDTRATSPLLETIGVLAAKHVPGKRGNLDFNVHFIVFSDLLQHSSRLSHYGPYPNAKDMKRTHPDLLSDLTGAEVSLYRLERPEYLRWQTADHYYWWTEYVEETGGTIRFQDSI